MNLVGFVRESNRIERIDRAPTAEEIEAHKEVMRQPKITVAVLEQFVWTVAKGRLRVRVGMNVEVGGATVQPPPGGAYIERQLATLLRTIQLPNRPLTPYIAHLSFESLHPFTDGNGRSGRALWAWMMREAGEEPFGMRFLHRFYYQAIDASREADYENAS